MRDLYGIDSQKLVWHPERVSDWLRGINIYPIFVEVGPIGKCLHRCIYCAFDYLGYQGPTLDFKVISSALANLAINGVKSIMLAGEGEPLMHPGIHNIIGFAKSRGLDVALTTNGVLFNNDMATQCLPFLTWVKFSVDAATRETYAAIHQCKAQHFDVLLSNIERTVKIRNSSSLPCTIGAQALLLDINADEMADLASIACDLGADYFAIKPFSKHPKMHRDFSVDYNKLTYLEDKLQKYETDSFKVFFRSHTMEKLRQDRGYQQCLGLPFMAVIDSYGDVYPCNIFVGDKSFSYGNINELPFTGIWAGEQRQLVMKRITEAGIGQCREVCRLDEINRYLWQLTKEPPPHVNFI